jgi:hypothetical protein
MAEKPSTRARPQLAFLRQRPIFDLSQVHVVIAVLQIEGMYDAQLMGGNLAQRLRLDADLLAMTEIAESLLEQWCRTISRDRRWSGEKRFKHDPVS